MSSNIRPESDDSDNKRSSNVLLRSDPAGKPVGRRDQEIDRQRQSDNKAIKSLKQRLYDEAKRRFPALKPITRPIAVGSLVFEPFKAKDLNAGWERYLPFINRVENKAKTTNFGKHVGDEEMRRFAKEIASGIADAELAEFEHAELIDDDANRGTYDGYMYHGRLLGYDPQFYGTAKIPDWAWPEPVEFEALHDISEVVINEPHANAGFPYLRPLYPRAKQKGSELYTKYVEMARVWMERVSAVQYPSTELLLSISQPIAIFWRAQSDGRPIWDLSKEEALPEGCVAQPHQRMLEGEAWYAYGDRAHRYQQGLRIIDGKAGTDMEDGDDFAIKLANGRILNGDASSFDASVRADQLLTYGQRVLQGARNISERISRSYMAVLKASLSLTGVCGIGRVLRTVPHGLISGMMSTHSGGSTIQHARVQCGKPWDSVNSVVSRMIKVGELMSVPKQHITSKSVEVAKLFCTRETMFGSVVRAVYGLCQFEDTPSEYFGPDDDDARVVAIVANSWSPNGAHPKWEKLCDWVRKHWEIRGAKARVQQLSKSKLDKRRLFQQSDNTTGEWERKALDAAWSALT